MPYAGGDFTFSLRVKPDIPESKVRATRAVVPTLAFACNPDIFFSAGTIYARV